METQTLLVYIALGLAAGFLVRKFVLKKKKSKKDCGSDCGCN